MLTDSVMRELERPGAPTAYSPGWFWSWCWNKKLVIEWLPWRGRTVRSAKQKANPKSLISEPILLFTFPPPCPLVFLIFIVFSFLFWFSLLTPFIPFLAASLISFFHCQLYAGLHFPPLYLHSTFLSILSFIFCSIHLYSSFVTIYPCISLFYPPFNSSLLCMFICFLLSLSQLPFSTLSLLHYLFLLIPFHFISSFHPHSDCFLFYFLFLSFSPYLFCSLIPLFSPPLCLFFFLPSLCLCFLLPLPPSPTIVSLFPLFFPFLVPLSLLLPSLFPLCLTLFPSSPSSLFLAGLSLLSHSFATVCKHFCVCGRDKRQTGHIIWGRPHSQTVSSSEFVEADEKHSWKYKTFRWGLSVLGLFKHFQYSAET